ncbi:MAG: glycogen synthase GlgA [Gammaproteobacteria bacterium]
MKILFAGSEVYPLIKTGGLADVAASLAAALNALGHDVKIMLPAYRDVLAAVDDAETIASLRLMDQAITLRRTRLADTEVWLVDAEPFNRAGNPYLAEGGKPWRDNAARFALFCRAVAAAAMGTAGLEWRPDLLHCHDWQSGLVPALLASEARRPAIVYTIHNLSYQGLFPQETFFELKLPESLWSPEALEFYGQLSFMKGGLIFSDRITAVSPGYAREIQTPEFGCGLDGLLRSRAAMLSGIVNGIDTDAWNPAVDPYLARPYDIDSFDNKQANKQALERAFGLPPRPDALLIGMIGRLVEQKGIDLLLDGLPALVKLPARVVLLGTGQPEYERALHDWQRRHPQTIGVRIGYDEALAHRIEAGADVFLMPSRFEPCGLNQMYSQRYGTVPIVRRTGGLQDTVTDTNPESLAAGTATGFVFDEATGAALLAAVNSALALYATPHRWRALAANGMRRDFSWRRSAADYLSVYDQALRDRRA